MTIYVPNFNLTKKINFFSTMRYKVLKFLYFCGVKLQSN